MKCQIRLIWEFYLVHMTLPITGVNGCPELESMVPYGEYKYTMYITCATEGLFTKGLFIYHEISQGMGSETKHWGEGEEGNY